MHKIKSLYVTVIKQKCINQMFCRQAVVYSRQVLFLEHLDILLTVCRILIQNNDCIQTVLWGNCVSIILGAGTRLADRFDRFQTKYPVYNIQSDIS